MRLPSISATFPALLLRILMGIIFITHGAARLFYNSISDFGGFLNSKGFVIGVFLAWVVTLGEIICGGLMAAGYKVKYCVVFHALVIMGGFFLVHLPNGWFVVGHGSGGVEYSILVLAVLLFLYSKAGK